MNYAERNTAVSSDPSMEVGLTDAAMERVNYFNQIASESLNMAELIKGKLFGHSTNEAGKNAPEPVPTCFADAFRYESERLSGRLQSLDCLLREINAKL